MKTISILYKKETREMCQSSYIKSILENKESNNFNKWHNWNTIDTKFFFLSIKKFGWNSRLIKSKFLRNKSINEIEEKIIFEELNNSKKMKRYLNKYMITMNSKKNYNFSAKQNEDKIMPIEFYWSDFFEIDKT